MYSTWYLSRGKVRQYYRLENSIPTNVYKILHNIVKDQTAWSSAALLPRVCESASASCFVARDKALLVCQQGTSKKDRTASRQAVNSLPRFFLCAAESRWACGVPSKTLVRYSAIVVGSITTDREEAIIRYV